MGAGGSGNALLSSYASQAGTGVSNSTMGNNVLNMLSRGTSFTHEDFPALNRVSETRAPPAAANNVPQGVPSLGAWHGAGAGGADTAEHLSGAPWHERHGPAAGKGAPDTGSLAARSGEAHAAMPQGGWSAATYGMHAGLPPRSGVAAAASGGNGAGTSAAHDPHGAADAVGGKALELDAQGRPVYTGEAAAAAAAAGAQLPINQVLASPADRFGLVGLVSLIKMQDPDLSMLTMSNNLQTLGMDLGSLESLYSSFVTPWTQDPSAASAQVEAAFHLPSCYNVQAPPPAQAKISSFSDETLFFIFYSTPRDVLQEVAAQELYARNWRYHRGLHLWLTKEQNTEPLQKTPTYERGTYVFFDPGTWEKVSKNFVLMYEMLEEKPPAQGMMPPVQQAPASQPPTPSQHPAMARAARSSAHASPGPNSPQPFSQGA